MKKIIGTLCVLGLSLQVQARGLIQEEVYVHDVSESVKKLVLGNPELTPDHLSKNGFELYGPKGMKKWLSEVGISYSEKPLNTYELKSLQSDVAFDYPSFEEMTKTLQKLAQDYPKLVKLFSIGKSVEGRDLWVVKISKEAHEDKVLPEFKYISTMHGDEVTGRELTVMLMQDMLKAYGKDHRITNLIDNTEIFIMPSMNPDGTKRRIRANAKYVDLNRNFPDWFEGDTNSTVGRQPETTAVMNFQAQRKFALSANFHGGAVVANYPWDNSYDRHPLDALLQEFSTIYANLNPEMKNSYEFEGGITNGADWYRISGGMQDWSYVWYGDLQITLEVSQVKWPRFKEIAGFYERNKESMLTYMELVHQGAGFKFQDKNLVGKVAIKDLSSSADLGTFGFSGGEFYKVLPVGEYEYQITLYGSDKSQIVNVKVEENSLKASGNYVEL